MKQWMINAATILFDDTKNDPALPKVVRLQVLTVLSFVWSTASHFISLGYGCSKCLDWISCWTYCNYICYVLYIPNSSMILKTVN